MLNFNGLTYIYRLCNHHYSQFQYTASCQKGTSRLSALLPPASQFEAITELWTATFYFCTFPYSAIIYEWNHVINELFWLAISLSRMYSRFSGIITHTSVFHSFLRPNKFLCVIILSFCLVIHLPVDRHELFTIFSYYKSRYYKKFGRLCVYLSFHFSWLYSWE